MKKTLLILALGLVTVTHLQASWLDNAREYYQEKIHPAVWPLELCLPRTADDTFARIAVLPLMAPLIHDSQNSILAQTLTAIPSASLAYLGMAMLIGKSPSFCPTEWTIFSVLPWQLKNPQATCYGNPTIKGPIETMFKDYLSEHNLLPSNMHVSFIFSNMIGRAPYAFYGKEKDIVYIALPTVDADLISIAWEACYDEDQPIDPERLHIAFDSYIQTHGDDVKRAALHAKNNHHQKFLTLSKSVMFADRLAGLALCAVPLIASRLEQSPAKLSSFLAATFIAAWAGRIFGCHTLGDKYYEYQNNIVEKQLTQLKS